MTSPARDTRPAHGGRDNDDCCANKECTRDVTTADTENVACGAPASHGTTGYGCSFSKARERAESVPSDPPCTGTSSKRAHPQAAIVGDPHRDKCCGSKSTCVDHDGTHVDQERNAKVVPSRDLFLATCSIIRHMSSGGGALNPYSEMTSATDAPPRPKLDNSVPKLWYFNARGRAEIIRLIFAQAGVKYEDLRFRGPPFAMKDFRQFKETHELPFGQVPVVEIDGMLLAQSQAIVRYLSRKYNLTANDEADNAIADMIFCGTEDLKQKFTALLFSRGAGDLEETETLVECFVKDVCPRWGAYFEKLLEKNGGEWMVGDHVTYADLAVYDMVASITWRLPTCFNQNLLLQGHVRRIEALPGIATYLSGRPEVPI